MKKILFATTALVAAGFTSSANAAEWETGVSGYYFLGLGLSDSNDQDGVGVLRDGEFHVNGRLTADNGITFQARVEVEAQTSGDQIDENWGRVSGSFGSVMIGGNDSVGYENNVAGIYAPGARLGYTDSFCITSACSSSNGSPAVGLPGDFVGIHYSTPDFYGFQLHGTYQPNRTSDAGPAGDGVTTAVTSTGDTNSIVFENNGQNGNPLAASDVSLYNIAADYNGDFGDFGFGLSGSYAELTNTPSQQWNIAARVDFSGFTVAGFYQDDFGNDEYGVGAQYATGPWTVAGGWSYSEADAHFAAGWITYAVAPGVSLTGGVEYANPNRGGSGDFGGLGYLTLRF